MSVWHSIGQQLRHPKGRVGQLMGHTMCLLNAKPNALAIAGLGIQPSDHILELGFGPGQAIARMAQLATSGKICGIDTSPVMLAQATHRNRRSVAAGKVFLSLGEFSPLAMADSSIDKILAVNVVYFWKSAQAILADCHRVLRFGGKVSIYATDAISMRRWKFAGSDTHMLYTAEDLHAALMQGGFAPNDIRIETLTLANGIQGILAVGQKAAEPILISTTP